MNDREANFLLTVYENLIFSKHEQIISWNYIMTSTKWRSRTQLKKLWTIIHLQEMVEPWKHIPTQQVNQHSDRKTNMNKILTSIVQTHKMFIEINIFWTTKIRKKKWQSRWTQTFHSKTSNHETQSPCWIHDLIFQTKWSIKFHINRTNVFWKLTKQTLYGMWLNNFILIRKIKNDLCLI